MGCVCGARRVGQLCTLDALPAGIARPLAAQASTPGVKGHFPRSWQLRRMRAAHVLRRVPHSEARPGRLHPAASPWRRVISVSFGLGSVPFPAPFPVSLPRPPSPGCPASEGRTCERSWARAEAEASRRHGTNGFRPRLRADSGRASGHTVLLTAETGTRVQGSLIGLLRWLGTQGHEGFNRRANFTTLMNRALVTGQPELRSEALSHNRHKS